MSAENRANGLAGVSCGSANSDDSYAAVDGVTRPVADAARNAFGSSPVTRYRGWLLLSPAIAAASGQSLWLSLSRSSGMRASNSRSRGVKSSSSRAIASLRRSRTSARRRRPSGVTSTRC